MHVLGLPPAFVLSHDQTLKLKVMRSSTFNPGPRSGIQRHPAQPPTLLDVRTFAHRHYPDVFRSPKETGPPSNEADYHHHRSANPKAHKPRWPISERSVSRTNDQTAHISLLRHHNFKERLPFGSNRRRSVSSTPPPVDAGYRQIRSRLQQVFFGLFLRWQSPVDARVIPA